MKSTTLKHSKKGIVWQRVSSKEVGYWGERVVMVVMVVVVVVMVVV